MLKEARTSKGTTGEAVLCGSAANVLIAGEATASSSVSGESASGKTLLRDSISSESTSSGTVSNDSTLNKAVPGENACDTHKSDNERETSKTRKRKRLKRRTKVRLGRAILLTLQIALLIIVYEIGCTVATFLPIDLPGNIVGMGLLLILLATGILKHKHVGRACDYLIDNMSIFFIPAGVGIMGCFTLLAGNGLKFAFVCITTTVIVFLATSWTVIAAQRLVESYARKKAIRAQSDKTKRSCSHKLTH